MDNVNFEKRFENIKKCTDPIDILNKTKTLITELWNEEFPNEIITNNKQLIDGFAKKLFFCDKIKGQILIHNSNNLNLLMQHSSQLDTTREMLAGVMKIEIYNDVMKSVLKSDICDEYINIRSQYINDIENNL